MYNPEPDENGNGVDGWEVDDYDGSVRIDSSNHGVGQEFTTGPDEVNNSFDPYVDAYLLTRISLSIENHSSNAGGMAFTAGIYLVNNDGTRGALVQYMNSDGVIGKDLAFVFTPYDDGPILLQPQTRYMFALECVNCDDGEERWISFDTTGDDLDNDHDGTTNFISAGDCLRGRAATVCNLYPPNHTGWEIENHHVTKAEGWVHDGYEDQTLITRADAIWLYYPEAPTDLTAVPASDKSGYVSLAWNSPERPVYEIPTSIYDFGDLCCYGPLPPPPGDDPEITHHEYRYKLSDDQAWGEWTEISHSAPGGAYANEYMVPGLQERPALRLPGAGGE